MRKNKNLNRQTKKEIDIVFLLDRSGSMKGIEEDTIGGYNGYIDNQKDNNVRVTTILFDDRYEMLHDRTKITDIKELTNKEYFVRGSTALLDAIGKTIKHLDTKAKEKVMFIITTDGMENASREYTKDMIKELIEGHSNWEFVYIGANIDSYSEGHSIGIKRQNIANYTQDKKGVSSMFKAVSRASKSYYTDECIDESWKKELE